MKISIIGIGKVGTSLAYTLVTKNYIRELVLVGRNRDVVRGEAMDLRHGQLFTDTTSKIIAGDIKHTQGSDIIAFCASAPTPVNMTDRMELATDNVDMLEQLLPSLSRLSPQCKIVILSNPVDVLVNFALDFTGFPPNCVMGTGTLVDSARFRQLLSEEVQIHTKDIRAYILGEHGESQFPAMSCAEAGGERLDSNPKRFAMAKEAAEAGFEVFQLKGHTNYAVALSAAYIIDSIALDCKHTMPISVKVDGYLGIKDICLSLPVVVGSEGVERILHPKLNTTEKSAFIHSADIVRATIAKVKRMKK